MVVEEVRRCDACGIRDREREVFPWVMHVAPSKKFDGDLCEECLDDVIQVAKPNSPAGFATRVQRGTDMWKIGANDLPTVDDIDPKTGYPKLKED